MLVADVGINGRHIHNNKRERTNDEIGDCLYRARGFWRRVPGLLTLHIVYYNFIHKSKASGSLTPAKAAGVLVTGPDTLKTLIQNAALAAA